METVAWSDAFVLGDAELDADHRRIIDAVNAAIGALNEGRADDCVATMRQIASLTADHFRREEAFLQKQAFLNLDSHAAYHRRLVGEMGIIVDACAERPDLAGIEARLAEMIHYLLNEIGGRDRELRRVCRAG